MTKYQKNGVSHQYSPHKHSNDIANEQQTDTLIVDSSVDDTDMPSIDFDDLIDADDDMEHLLGEEVDIATAFLADGEHLLSVDPDVIGPNVYYDDGTISQYTESEDTAAHISASVHNTSEHIKGAISETLTHESHKEHDEENTLTAVTELEASEDSEGTHTLPHEANVLPSDNDTLVFLQPDSLDSSVYTVIDNDTTIIENSDISVLTQSDSVSVFPTIQIVDDNNDTIIDTHTPQQQLDGLNVGAYTIVNNDATIIENSDILVLTQSDSLNSYTATHTTISDNDTITEANTHMNSNDINEHTQTLPKKRKRACNDSKRAAKKPCTSAQRSESAVLPTTSKHTSTSAHDDITICCKMPFNDLSFFVKHNSQLIKVQDETERDNILCYLSDSNTTTKTYSNISACDGVISVEFAFPLSATHTKQTQKKKHSHSYTTQTKSYMSSIAHTSQCVEDSSDDVQDSVISEEQTTESSAYPVVYTQHEKVLYSSTIYTLTPQEKQARQLIAHMCQQTPHNSIKIMGNTSIPLLTEHNVTLQTIRNFSNSFPSTYTQCQHVSMQECDACFLVRTHARQIYGHHVLGQLARQNVRLSRMCNPIVMCMLMMCEYYGPRQTVAHDRYIYNVKLLILPTETYCRLSTITYDSIYAYYQQRATQTTDVPDNENAYTFLSQYHKEFKQLFLHQFALCIKESLTSSVYAYSPRMTPDTLACVQAMFRNRQEREYYVVSADKEYMKRDMLEYLDRMSCLKQELINSNRVIGGLKKQPYASYMALLFNTEELFSIFTQQNFFIAPNNFALVVRRWRASAKCACIVRAAIIEDAQKSNTYNHCVMKGMSLFMHTDPYTRTMLTCVTSGDEVMLERKKYFQIIRECPCMRTKENQRLIDACIYTINVRIAREPINIQSTSAEIMLEYQQAATLMPIVNQTSKITEILQQNGFIAIERTFRPKIERHDAAYPKFTLQDVSDQVAVADALDVSFCHTLYILSDVFYKVRNIMVCVLLDIWFRRNECFAENDFAKYDRAALSNEISKYDQVVMERFLTILQKTQELKAKNLHTLLPYELECLGLKESSCRACEIIHGGHACYTEDNEICISLLCLSEAAEALIELLPSIKVTIDFSHLFITQDITSEIALINAVFNTLTSCTIQKNCTPDTSWLNQKLHNILLAPDKKQ